LQRKLGRFGFACGKSSREPPNFFLRDGSEKLHAGQTRSREQLGKLLFRKGAFQRYPVQ
jgi:hypothetical protein